MADFTFDFDPADHLTIDAIGEPGQRTFFLQAGRGIEFVSMICEKEQMAALSEGLLGLLDQVAEAFSRSTGDPRDAIDFDLIQPVIPVWRIAQMGVGYDDADDRIIIVVQEMVDEGETPEVGRFTINREHARAFAHHIMEIVTAGRPACPFCGEPLDPAGHFCPKSNGHGKQYLQ